MDDRDTRIRELERRLDRLAREKAKSQLLGEVMRSFRAAATLEEILQSIINNALMFHGGMSVRLYYNLGSRWYLHDLDGDKGLVEICENPMLEEVLRKKTYVEQLEEAPREFFNDIHQDMQKHTGLCASGIPLIVNGSIIAVLELRGRMLYDFEFQEEFDTFFSYSGIVLQNAVLNRNALSEMESEYRQIFESYNDGVMVVDQSYRIRRVNGMMCRLLDMDRDQLSGLSVLDFAFVNDEAEYWLKDPISDDSIYSSDTVFLNPKTQEQQFCILIIGTLKDSDDRPAGYIIGLKDIGHRVRAAEKLRVSEERLRLAMKGSNDGLWDWNIQTDEWYFSPRCRDIFECSESELRDRLLDRGRTSFMEQIEALMDGRSDRFEAEFSFPHQNGTSTDVLGRAILLKDRNGEAFRLIGTLTDLSEIKKKERELRMAKETAEENERIKSTFLANMSHEIRTPMNGIIGFSRMLADMDISKEESRKCAGIVLESTQRLLKIVNDILDISQIESGAMVLKPSDTNLNRLLDKLYTFYAQQCNAQNLDLKVMKALDDLTAEILVDPVRLEQVLSNLISNAMKFTEHGGIDFGYRLSDGRLVFHVHDTGIGIPEEDHQKIFRRFEQSSNGQEQRFGGSGLGLSISSEIAKMMGGELTLSSTVGEGSTFSFSIPYSPTHESRLTSF